jgi:hypothetical protein
VSRGPGINVPGPSCINIIYMETQETIDERADRILEGLRTLFEQRGFSDTSRLLYAYRNECKECIKKESY